MKHPKMFLLKWNVIIGVKGYSGFKPKISNHLEVGKNGKTLKNLTKTMHSLQIDNVFPSFKGDSMFSFN